ncbi:helix-turn-helix domain-containing protein [Microbacterium sp. YY-01]|uniref:helix-turn-helix domain-containing protein n=1 Tax=Microbacterium sp. YY-01 TaxID=3421634 RepID=UPI003D170A13
MSGKRYGTYAVMAWLAELDLTVMWGAGRGSAAAASTSRAILQTIANFVDQSNSAYPGIEKIAGHCDNITARTVKRHLKRAREMGLITTERKNLGYRRGKDIITFDLTVTQETLNNVAKSHPHRVTSWRADATSGQEEQSIKPSPVEQLEAENERLRARLAALEASNSSQGDTVSPWEDPADSEIEEDSRVTLGRGHVRPLPPKVTTPNNHSSSSVEEPVSEHVTVEDEESESPTAKRLTEVHPALDLATIRGRLRDAGIDVADVDVVAAATEVIASRAGARIGSPSAYVATSIIRERWRWPRGGQSDWDQLVSEAESFLPRCDSGIHRWLSMADGDDYCPSCGALKSKDDDAGRPDGVTAA